jgi:hypothetical protein
MDMLRIGVLTTWNTRCGIAEYSRSLISALRRRGDVSVTVFGSRNIAERSVREYEDWATPVFDVQVWNPRHTYDFDIDAILAQDFDVLHVQYSNLFYNRRKLIDLMTRFPGLVALTYHDKVVGRFPHTLPDLLYAHREDVGVGNRRFIPQGIDLRPPIIKTFGLGKADVDVISEICDRNGWQFEKSFGEDRWLEYEELYQWLRDCDAIVLWYREDPTSGGSAAAPLAISTRRPVFVNDTEWFRDLPGHTTTLRKVGDPDELEAGLRELFVDHYAEQRTWDHVAETLVEDYKVALSDPSSGPTEERRSTFGARLFALRDPKPFIRVIAWLFPLGLLRRVAHRMRQSLYFFKRPAGR